jgi:hypothetical protein
MILVTFIFIHFVIICVVLLWRTYETHSTLFLKFRCDTVKQIKKIALEHVYVSICYRGLPTESDDQGSDSASERKLTASSIVVCVRLSPVHSLPLTPATSALASTLAPAAPVHRLQQATASVYSHVSFSISELSNSRGFISTLRKHTT